MNGVLDDARFHVMVGVGTPLATQSTNRVLLSRMYTGDIFFTIGGTVNYKDVVIAL